MALRSRFWLFVATCVALASLGVLAYAARAPSSEQHYAFDHAVRDLRRLDRALNQDVLQARFQLVNTYDPVVATTTRMHELRAELHHPPSFLSSEDLVAVEAAIRAYEDALDRKDALIERFKSANSVLKNSLRYLPALAMRLADHLEQDAATLQIASSVRRLLELVLLHNVTSDDGYRRRVEEELGRLEGAGEGPSESDRAMLASVLAHARVVLRTKPVVDDLVARIFAVPTDPLEESIQAVYERGRARATVRASRFGNGVLVLAAMLLGLVVFAFVRLRAALGSLASANATLESKVVRRTAAIEAEAERARRALEELRRAQTELVQAQKLVSIGQLAAGVAHEINTPIQYVGDNTRFLQSAIGTLLSVVDAQNGVIGASGESPTEEARTRLDSVRKKSKLEYLRREAPRAIEQSIEGLGLVAHIVGAMKSFSHPSGGELGPVDLREAFESTVTISRNEWKYVAELTLDVDPAMPPVECLRDQLNQVVLNLIVNAAHAIAERPRENGALGKIAITVREVGDAAEIRVSDDGAGIPVELRARIFDPFFTTKPVGKGSGQGLAIAYGVVVGKHGGTITVESEVGRGTTFVVRIPMRRAAVPAAA